MNKKQILMIRVKSLLESKSNKFNRKYFLLSALADTNIKKSEELFAEALCYANVLVETNGSKPSEEYLIKLNEEALKFSGVKNIKKRINFIKNYNDILNSKNNLLKESIIDEELTNILNNNYKLNNKLYETLIESIRKKVCLLMESESEVRKKKNKEILDILKKQEQMFFGDDDDDDDDEFYDVDEELYDSFDDEELESQSDITKNIFSKNPSLSKLGYTSDKYVPGEKSVQRLKAIEKVGVDAINKISKMSNVAKRKFDIIRQIQFYLNVQQQYNLGKIEDQKLADLSKSKEEFSLRPSGLLEDEVEALRKKLDIILLRHENFEELDLDSDIITEKELVALLRKAAGNQTSNVLHYLENLDRRFPLDEDQTLEPVEHDEDFVKDMSLLDKEQYDEDQLAKLEAGIDPETGQPLYEPDPKKVAQMSAAQAAEKDKLSADELPPQEEIKAEDALNLLKQSFGPMSKIKDLLDNVSPELSNMIDNQEFTMADLRDELENISDTIDPEIAKELEELIDAINKNDTINIKVLPPKSKADIRSELYDTASTPEDFAYFVSKFVDTDKPLTLRDLGALISHGEEGVASDANAVRQALTKSWFRATFFSFDDDKKANIYATLADKWFSTLEMLDLFKDDTIKIPGQKDLSGSGASRYFDNIKKIMTIPNNIKKFLTSEFENQDSKDSFEKNDIIDVMLTGNNGFRVFATSLMKDYYTNNVWNQCEQDLAYAIREYFNKNYSSSNIAKDLNKGEKSRKVKKEQGKTFFDTIIYAVMGRTGIKDSKGSLGTPDKMISQRKDAFRNKSKFLDRVNKFNIEFPQNRLVSKFGSGSSFDEKDLDALINDMFNPNGIIGGTFTKFQKMSNDEYNNFVDWVENLKEQDLMTAASQALVLSTASSILKPDEFMKPSMAKSYSKEAQGRLKEYMKLYKDQINQQRKNLKIEEAEDVMYNGQKCEVDDIEMDKKIIHIYLPDDTLIKVPFDQVSLVK